MHAAIKLFSMLVHRYQRDSACETKKIVPQHTTSADFWAEAVLLTTMKAKIMQSRSQLGCSTTNRFRRSPPADIKNTVAIPLTSQGRIGSIF
jgi:hypothetical protein